jgi:GAF domain-containing protein
MIDHEDSRREMLEACREMSREALGLQDQLRVRRLHDLNIFNEAEEIFDVIVVLAAKACRASTAMMTLVSLDEAYIKSSLNGLPIGPEPRGDAFCNLTIKSPHDVLVIEKASRDKRFANNWKVEQKVLEFYAGAPIISHDGIALGALCITDKKTRKITADEIASLQSFARIISYVLDTRDRGGAMRLG